MNIFVLHRNPRKAARWHLDKHVIKMILETCQLLYTAHWILFYPHLKEQKSAVGLSRAQKQLSIPAYLQSAPLCQTTKEPTYRPTHAHHPCARWARATSGNYRWLVTLGQELAREFRYRFHKVHACETHIEWLAAHLPPTIQRYPKRPFVMAMDQAYRISENPVESYRHYYGTAKRELIHYTRRHVPHWLLPEGFRPNGLLPHLPPSPHHPTDVQQKAAKRPVFAR